MADEFEGGSGSPENASIQSGNDSAVGSGQTEPSAASSAPSGEGSAAGSGDSQPAVQPAPQEQWDDIRDVAQQYGLNLGHIPSSEEAARHLIQLARQNDAYRSYGQQLAPYYQQFQQFLQAQQRPQAPQQQRTPPNYFGLPEYEPKWLDWIERDPQGNLTLKPGAPPDTLHKVMQYQAAVRDFQTNFYKEPQRYLTPMIRDAVSPLVQQAIQNQMRSYQDHVFSTNFIAQNSNWLYHKDPQGQVIRDPVSGAYALTPEGQLFVQHVQRARSMGINDVQTAQGYAMDQMRLAYHEAQARQQGATQQRSAQDQAFLQQHNRRPPANHGGSLPPPNGQSQNPEEPLASRLERAMRAQYTDARLAAEIGGAEFAGAS